MFYMLDQSVGAEDDGTAWTFRQVGTGYVRTQIAPLTVHLLRDGLRAFAVGGEIVVDEELAAELGSFAPGLVANSLPVRVIGPQPAMEPRPPMIQLVGQTFVRLARECVARDADGTIAFRQPYVLDASQRSAATICKIEENGMTLVSKEVRDRLKAREPNVFFKPVRFEDEALPVAEPPPPPTRIPSADEVKGRWRK